MAWYDSLFENFDVGKFIGGAGAAGIGAYGYGELQEQFGESRENIFGSGGFLESTEADIRGAGEFQPWSVRSGLGATGFTPYDPVTGTGGQMTNQLSQQQQGFANQMGQGGMSMMNQAMGMDPRFSNQYNQANTRGGQYNQQSQQAMMNSMQDTSAREGDIYERMRAMQRPGEQRQQDSMNAGLFGSGRGGMSTEAYGGSPEQHAFGLAQAEARNTASFGAMNQAQSEMMNQGQLASQYGNMAQGYGGLGQSALTSGMQNQMGMSQMGNQMFQNQYMPHQQMQAYGNQGLQQAQMSSQSGQNMAGLLAQLGIGGMTTDVNFANVQGESLVGLLEMLGGAFGGAAEGLL